jgi:hypothetical protein
MPFGPGDSLHSGMMPPIPPAQNVYENFYHSRMAWTAWAAWGALLPEHPLEPDSFSEGGPQGRVKPGTSVPDILPSAPRALYLRIQQKQQEEEERARRLGESNKQDQENEEGDTGEWYSSDEDEGGSSVTSILKTLKQQTSSRSQASVGELSSSGLGDPRLPKGHPTAGRPPLQPGSQTLSPCLGCW